MDIKTVLLVVLPLLACATYAQNLQVVITNTKLLSKQNDIPTLYDGDDSIYMLGGETGYLTWNYDILKYSISAQTIQKIGTMGNRKAGSGVWGGNRNVLYFGGYKNVDPMHTEIWSFSIDDPNNWRIVSNLPEGCYSSTSIWDHVDNTYTIGGILYFSLSTYVPLDTITKYSGINETVEIVGQLPSPRYGTSAVWDNTTEYAYIFGGMMTEFVHLKEILRFDPTTGIVTKLDVDLPEPLTSTCAIWNGKEAFIIGGLAPDSTVPLVVFNPETNQAKVVPLDNFPPNLFGTGCVFVEKLNRIYIMGGRFSNIGLRSDGIMYIDLGGVTPSTTIPAITTTPHPPHFECPTEDGVYADPKNCRGFYNCVDWVPHVSCCPLPLFYNGFTGRCDLPDMVECHNDTTLPCDSPPGSLVD